MVRNRQDPRPPNGRSPLTVVVAASLLAGSIGSYSLMAPGGLNLLDAQGGRPGVVTASTPGQAAALMAYQRPAQGRGALLAGGSKPGPNRALPIQVLPSDAPLFGNKPITFSLFAGWGGAITWDPNSGEVTVALGVGRQYSISVNDLPSSGSAKQGDGSFFKGAGIQGEFGGKIPQALASKVPGLSMAAGATITGKLNGKWSATDGSLTFRAIGQIKLPSALASQLPAELQALFKNGSLSYGYQWKVDTHGSADARNWTIISSQTGTLDGQSYSFGSPGTSATGTAANTLAAIGNQVFDFFKGGDFGGHVAGNVTVALPPHVRDAINNYMKQAFGDYSKQVNQDTKKLQNSNGQLQKDLKKDQSPQTQQQIKSLGNQIGTESGQLQKDILGYQKNTAQGVLDILRKYNQPPPTKQAPQAPGLPPGRQNDPATGTRLPFTLPPNQSTTGAPPTPGGGPRVGGTQGGQPGGPSSQPARNPGQPGGTAQSGGTGIKPGPVQGLPGTQSGPWRRPRGPAGHPVPAKHPAPSKHSALVRQPGRFGYRAARRERHPGQVLGSASRPWRGVRCGGRARRAGPLAHAAPLRRHHAHPADYPAPAAADQRSPPPAARAPWRQPATSQPAATYPAASRPAASEPAAGDQPAGGQDQQAGGATPPAGTQGGGQTQRRLPAAADRHHGPACLTARRPGPGPARHPVRGGRHAAEPAARVHGRG